MKKLLVALLLVCFAVPLLGAAYAADYPTRDITLIVGAAPGGATDTIARLLGAQILKNTGKSAVVMNRTGGGGAIGQTFGSQARPDGYNVTVITTEASTMHLMGTAKYSFRDFEHVALIATAPAVLAVTADSPFKTYADFLDAVKKDPDKIKVGALAEGSIWNLALRLVDKGSGVKTTPVPYDGGAPAITAALGNHVDAVACGFSEILPFVQDGRMRILGVTSAKRPEAYPDAPTFIEQGCQAEIGAWWGIALPKNTPKDIVDDVKKVFREAITSQETRDFLKSRGFEYNYQEGPDFTKWLNDMDPIFKKAVE
ncbi:tripartite tricarboxylate transporter substrate binding protein [Synergistaceae bacterium OttesenSCG-928-I11]|nr:tripartite tricarboxylate transporter substrate binding protein [Synergistaceae bacterium OttesenSCG-928-I11]